MCGWRRAAFTMPSPRVEWARSRARTLPASRRPGCTEWKSVFFSLSLCLSWCSTATRRSFRRPNRPGDRAAAPRSRVRPLPALLLAPPPAEAEAVAPTTPQEAPLGRRSGRARHRCRERRRPRCLHEPRRGAQELDAEALQGRHRVRRSISCRRSSAAVRGRLRSWRRTASSRRRCGTRSTTPAPGADDGRPRRRRCRSSIVTRPVSPSARTSASIPRIPTSSTSPPAVSQNGAPLNPTVQWGPALGTRHHRAKRQLQSAGAADLLSRRVRHACEDVEHPEEPERGRDFGFVGVDDHYFLTAALPGNERLHVEYQPVSVPVDGSDDGRQLRVLVDTCAWPDDAVGAVFPRSEGFRRARRRRSQSRPRDRLRDVLVARRSAAARAEVGQRLSRATTAGRSSR